MDTLKIDQTATASVIRRKPDTLSPKGWFRVEHYRNGVKIGEYNTPNAITDQGRQKMLDVMFDSATHITAWYMGIVDSTSYSALAAGDSYAQIGGSNGWHEYTNYTDDANGNSAVTRPGWGAGASSVLSHVVSTTNATSAVFDITSGGSGTVKGLFIVGGTNAQTKSDNTASGNVLWSSALFAGGDVTVLNGDQLKVTYTISV